MPIRITGMNSGLDTESLVSELVSAYKQKGTKYEKAQGKIAWKQEAWKSLSSKTYSFRTGLDKMRFSSGYSLKTSSVSNASKASITAGNNAVNGTQTLKITQLAKSGYLTGEKMTRATGAAIESGTMLGELGLGGSGNISVNGKQITFDSTTTVSDFISKMNDAGVKANFDATNQRIFISSTDSGADSDFTMTALDTNGTVALNKLGLNIKTDSEKYVKAYGDMNDEELASVLESYGSATGDADGLIANFAKQYAEAASASKGLIISEFKGFISYQKSLYQEENYVKEYGERTKELESKLKSYDATDTSDPVLADFAAKYQAATNDDDRQAIVQELMLKTYDGTDTILAGFAKEYKDAGDDVSKKADVLQRFSTSIADATNDMSMYNEKAIRIYGQDAKIELNGVEFTSKSNSFSINGLTINALATTDENEVLTVTTATDNQGIYDKIKDFFSDYNDLINSMTKSYNAESASDYEPLTDDEKESMSDTEIEKWEAKGKGAILRRDTTLSTLMSVMTTAMAKSYTINGKSYALSSFGIKTLGIMNAEDNEQNAYHIDGDADDESTSSNTDKLMAAIIADPEGVTEFFKKITSDLYSNLGEQMSATTLRSYGSFYNDKQLDTEYKSYTTKISDWDQKVQDIEDSYYKKFAKMESALASLQSQQSSLSGLLGS